MVDINSIGYQTKNDIMFFELMVDINSTGNQSKNDVNSKFESMVDKSASL